MSAPDGFEHCPRCAAPDLRFEQARHQCGACGWLFHRNPAAAVFAILEHDERVLLVRRALAPAAGTLDLPGGFLDLGETAEAGLARELDEELGLRACSLRYLGTYPNVYPFSGVTYHTLDLCFHGILAAEPERARMDEQELSEFVLTPRAEVDLDAIGMDSPRRALADYLDRSWAGAPAR